MAKVSANLTFVSTRTSVDLKWVALSGAIADRCFEAWCAAMTCSEQVGLRWVPRKMAGDGDYYIQLIFFGSLNHPIPTQAFDSLE